MKRFHVHLRVDDLATSIGFYSKLFAAAPDRVEADYAKWMLDDPRVNFAISMRGGPAGLDHLGFQTDESGELDALRERARSADLAMRDEGRTTCCYARSDKHWIADPQGVPWEHFHTLDTIPVFSEPEQGADDASVCCAPATTPASMAVGCCAPAAAGTARAEPTPEGATCCPPPGRGQAASIRAKSGSSCC